MRNSSRWAFVFGLAVAVLVGPSAVAQVELQYPLVTATQAEYAQGDTAVLLGYDFQAGKELLIVVTRPDGTITNARGRKGQADTVTTDAWGQFGYEYPQLNQEGFYFVDIIDAATVGKGKDKFKGDILASTVFKDNIVNDHELVGQPLAQCGANRPPAHGSSPPTPSHGHDGLVDALAGSCLVGTVDIWNTDPAASIQGFAWHLDPSELSNLQGGGLRPFINQVETVDIVNTGPDADVGNSQADDGQGGCASDCYYTTAGNMTIPQDFNPHTVIGQDGTEFSIRYLGSVPNGPVVGGRYLVTVVSDVNSARFEYCGRIDPDAGDGDLGNDGRVDSSPVTGGEEVSPINICRIEDQTPPICIVTPDGDCAGDIFVSDPDGGVQQIEVLQQINMSACFDNPSPGVCTSEGDVVSYVPPTTDDINIRVEKLDCAAYGWFEIEITNSAGLTTVCDPVDVTLLRANGRPERHQFTLNDREGYLFINNHGLREIFMNVNGHRLHFSHNRGTGNNAFSMPENGGATYEIFEFLKAGENVIEIQAVGPPNGSARIFIHD